MPPCQLVGAADQFVLLKDVTVINTFNAESCRCCNLFYEIFVIICLPYYAQDIINNLCLNVAGKFTLTVNKIKLNVSDLVHHCCYSVLQQLWIVFLCFCNQFIYTVLVVILIHDIIQ